ncbi:MAG: aromatic-ring-hydroxylating dioxygenase subunit beta [Gammaproteobacteria bacterium]|nr:aromatic-ring-hydroxylating dioxygenase subunit beta [Gammaproteobacteria bacterium]
MNAASVGATRDELEDFLYAEAALLDAWRLDEWLALFVEGARYFIPPAGAEDDADPSTSLFYVADDYHRLCERVKRLKKRTAHAEFPRSRCRRLVSNVRVVEGDAARFTLTSNFVTWRSKLGVTDTFFGHHLYEMTRVDGALRILSKKTFLDQDDIRDQGKVSIIP